MYQRSDVLHALAVVLVTGSALVLFNSHPLLAQNNSNASTQDDFGVNTTNFDTPHGKIRVNMPDDATAGDTLSGSVYAYPAGKTQKEMARNEDELNGYVVEVENKKTNVGKKMLEFGVPAAAGGTAAYLILRDKGGNEVAQSTVPVQPVKPVTERPAPPAIKLPTVSQAGRPLNITGPFDGDSKTTDVTIAGEKTEVLAESPRKTTVQAPSESVGLQPIHVKKGAAEASGTVRNLGIKLSAPKTKLDKGETTSLTVTVRGLEDLKTDTPVDLVNHSDSVVGLEGGDKQTFTVHPSDVQPGGTFTITRTLTGREPGNFNLLAIVSESMPIYGDNAGGITEGPGTKEDVKKACKDCTASDTNGPDKSSEDVSCSSPDNCKADNEPLINERANQTCHDDNISNCDGDCGTGKHCDGIYDHERSSGLKLTAAVDRANPKHCPGTKVTCKNRLVIPAGATLACKCSCNPGAPK